MTDLPGSSPLADVLLAAGCSGWLTPPLWRVVAPGSPLLAPACTVRLAPGDDGRGLTPLFDALDGGADGCALVIAGAGEVDGAVWGEILTVAALAGGVRAACIDGYVRDTVALAAMGLPVVALGERTVGPGAAVSVVSVGEPVSIGEVTVSPGDPVLVDHDGVVCLRAASSDEALDRARVYAAAEAQVLERLRSGAPLAEAYGAKKEVVAALRQRGALETA
ncbi:MAG: RraA family protein [Acidimicrobiales bacterium]